MLEPLSACSMHFTSRVSYSKFQLKQNENKLLHFHMHLHMLQMHLSSILQNDASPEINVLHKNHLNHVQKRWHAKPVEIKCSLEVVVVEQIHHARQNKFQTISKNIILTVNVQKHILEKCCSPWKRSQPSTKLVQTWWHHAAFQKIPKTTIYTSSVGETWWKQISSHQPAIWIQIPE